LGEESPRVEEAEMPGNTVRELAYRESEGLEVTLLWRPDDDALSVLVVDTRSRNCFMLPAERDHALDVFNHPFAHARLRAADSGVPADRRLVA
jgi:hypothetical protein